MPGILLLYHLIKYGKIFYSRDFIKILFVLKKNNLMVIIHGIEQSSKKIQQTDPVPDKERLMMPPQ
jgi:hypothetical protein